ncbi:MAG: GTPase Era [Bacteroidetes bacterium]|nr:GTPase Era [Bacteroidota bacterium]
MPKVGYVAIIGKPNVGKSTLMNAIVGAKLSIVTPKPQTTRKNVLGIYTADDVQIVFLDTPGALVPRYEMQRSMMDYVHKSIDEADVIVVLADATHGLHALNYLTEEFMEILKQSNKPILLAINKTDALKDRKEVLPLILEFQKLNVFKEFLPISALKNKVIDELVKTITEYLPEGEFLYEQDFLSDQPERFFVAEIIRETIFMEYGQEIPYSCEINITEFLEREAGKWFIGAEIIIERSTQKGIIIGAKGQKIKEVGQRARYKIEKHLEKPVFLELFVKVRDNWRNNKTMLKSYGY